MKLRSFLMLPLLLVAPIRGGGSDLAAPVVLISSDSSGASGNGDSDDPSVSADGRFVAFQSASTNLVAGDTNGVTDIFVKDRVTGAIVRASTDAAATQGNGNSGRPSISGDGTLVAFTSGSSNFVAGDGSGDDVFAKNLTTNAIIRVSTDSSGAAVNGDSWGATISEDGRFVAFSSDASDLVPGDTNGITDVFVKDLATGAVTRASTDASGGQADNWSAWSAISRDGTFVGFASAATNLVAGDTNSRDDIFLKNLVTGAVTRVSTTASEGQGNQDSSGATIPALSSDVGLVAFVSLATNLVGGDSNNTHDVFVKNLATGAVTRASTSSTGAQASSGAYVPSLSGNGRLVTFQTSASNFVPGDTNASGDVFARNLSTGVVTRVTTGASGEQADFGGSNSDLSSDGKWLAFLSQSTNLVAGSANGAGQIFAKDVSSLSTVIPELSALSLGGATLSPAFEKDTTAYSAAVAHNVATATVTPAVSEAGLAIEVRVNGGAYNGVNSGDASAALPLVAGANLVEVRVTAPDMTERIYTITVTRATPPRLTMRRPRAFRPTPVGRKSRPQILFVTNVGGSAAANLTVATGGAARRDFLLGRPAARTLAAGASTTFRATFRPRKKGVRRAIVTVRSTAVPVNATLIGRGR